ncbi:MAG: radical SAM protein [Magnetococcus sp. DMHC-6]
MDISNKLNIVQKALNYKIFKKRAPIVTSLSITGRCNLSCPYCYSAVYTREQKEYTLTQIKQFIDDFYTLGARIFFLQGGEPTLREDIGEIIDHILAKKCYVSASSNGTITERMVDMRNIHRLEFTIDGPPEVNDKSRGKGSFEKTMTTAQTCKTLGIPFHFHSVLNPHSELERDIRFVCGLADQLGTTVTVCFAMPSSYKNTVKFIGRNKDQKIKKAYELLFLLKKEGLPISSTDMALHHALNWPLSHGQIMFPHNIPKGYSNRCIHGRLTAWLDHEGWLYPCPTAFGHENLRVAVEEDGVIPAWKKLGEVLNCVDCGIASELTYLLQLHPKALFAARKY